MADLDFSRNVPATQEGAPLAKLQRQDRVEVTPVPDLQGAISKYAQDTNVLSTIGASVAAKASNAIATKIGGELGKNPQGDLGPVITDFDKTMHESYRTQAQATLGLQANKLITDSNLEAAKATRITPDLIKKTNQSIASGLNSILQNAPDEIKPDLQLQFGNAQLHQADQLTERMIREGKEDFRNNTILANNQNAEDAHALAASGKFDEADRLLKSTMARNNSAVASNIGFTPQQAKVGTDTVRQTIVAGKLQYQYEKAVKEKKQDEFLKNLANRPSWISDADYPGAMESLRSYVSNKEALSSNYENLVMSDFKTKMAVDIGSITGNELQSALDKLSPTNASKLNLEYATAYKAYKKESYDQNNLALHWDDPTAQANASEKIKNNTFNGKVAYVMNQSPNTSRDDAEFQVAASAGADIPVFTTTMKKKLWGGDPGSMVSVAKQIDALQQSGNGHALAGLNEQDLALASDIKHNYNPADPASAARIITDNKENQDTTVRRDSEAAFSNMLFDNTRKNNTSTDDFILKTFGMQDSIFHGNKFDSPWAKSTYASDILSNYRTNFINTRRDNDRAISLTQQYVDNNYGKTSINGSSEWTLHPIEKACGFAEGEGTSIINKDIMRQLAKPLAKQKAKYDDKKTDVYWTMQTVTESKPGSLRLPGDVIERIHFIKHTREGVATKTEVYPLRLVGNNFNWDLNLETAHGPRSNFLEDPTIGVNTYTPDIKWIKEHPHG
jgi:hypothetical protein